MEKEILSKSDLLSMLQCPRKLWLEHNQPSLIPNDDSALHRRATDGNIVGEKAREQLGEPFLWPPTSGDKLAAANNAKDLLAASPDLPAVEVPMLRKNLYARADALIPTVGGYALRETKSSSFPLKKDKVTPADPKAHYLSDVAIQTWVMEGMGLPIDRVELNLLDNQWRYPGNEAYSGLFKQLDVSAEIKPLKTQVPNWLQNSQNTLAGDLPSVATGKHCSDPYECPFRSFCKPLDPLGPEHPIELLPDSAGKKLASKLKNSKGYVSILEPDPDELTGKQAPLYRRIQSAHSTGSEVFEPGSDVILNALPYPRYYFDFEGIDLPVPRWKGVRPYEQIPFQWSCHIERSPGILEHAEFLDLSGDDPSLPCIERMQEVIDPDDDGPIFVYYATYEKNRLEELAKRHPEQTEIVQKYVARIFDLLPVVKAHYYHPAMRGSFSIKKVLKVIAPDLDYGELDEVQEGTGAQVAYLYAAIDSNTSPERRAELETKLRIYCRQDTWAMVELAYFLARLRRPIRPGGM